MRWEQGRAAVDRMIVDKELERVPPSRRQADRLLAQSDRHLVSATGSATMTRKAPMRWSMTQLARHWLPSSRTRGCARPRAAATWPSTMPCGPSWTRRWAGLCGPSTGCAASGMTLSIRQQMPLS